ncbi:MAG: methylated-DNA--[protein]-cysteine S-methyltransferase [Ilumatobacteraceae bacterium]
MDRLISTTMGSPVGELTLVAGARGLRAVMWPNERPDRVPLAAGIVGLADAADDDAAIVAVLQQAVRQLGEYFDGERHEFDLPLDPMGTEFQQQVWQVLRTIPYGQTISYGEQADRLGDRNKSRAVGAANGRNPLSIVVPCHRVIGSTGKLTGFAAGVDAKAWLLQHEQGGRLAL